MSRKRDASASAIVARHVEAGADGFEHEEIVSEEGATYEYEFIHKVLGRSRR